MILAASDPLSHAVPHALHPEPIYSWDVPGVSGDVPFLGIYNGVYNFHITNHLMMTAVVGILVILVFAWVSRKISTKSGKGLEAFQTKGRLSQLFETLCAFIRDEVAYPNLGHLTDKYIPYIWTIFFFILFSNVIGIMPIGYALALFTGDSHFEHFGGTATGNLALNSMLALLSLIMIIWISIRETSAKEFFNHFNPIGWDGGIGMLPIALLLYVLEWLSLFIKCVVLAMRLFGTMMAGHLVLAAFVGLIFAAQELGNGAGYGVGILVVLMGTALTLLELFVCFLQAFIFTFLTVLFIAATAVHHDEHGHEEHDALSDAAQTDPDKILDPGKLGPATNL
ncbi:MAG: F0F1 ATP synthase subunit A [Planctomycetota bacterium]